MCEYEGICSLQVLIELFVEITSFEGVMSRFHSAHRRNLGPRLSLCREDQSTRRMCEYESICSLRVVIELFVEIILHVNILFNVYLARFQR